jgi:hypothetical protein
MGALLDRLAEFAGVLIVAYAANDSFRASVLLSIALLGALAGVAVRLYAQPDGGSVLGPLR